MIRDPSLTSSLLFRSAGLASIVFLLGQTAGASLSEYQALERQKLDGRQVAVSGLTIERDAFALQLDGTVYLFEEVMEQTPGGVFVGQGKWLLEPASERERHHLAVIQSDPQLEVLRDTFEVAILRYWDDTTAEILAAGELSTGAVAPQAAKAVDAWRDSKARLEKSLSLRLLRAATNDEGLAGKPFFALVEGKRWEETRLGIDPAGLFDDEEVYVTFQGEKGGSYAEHLESEVESGAYLYAHPKTLVDVQHHAIDTHIVKNSDLEATAEITFSVLAPALRVIPFSLTRGFEIEEAVLVTESGETALAVISTLDEDGDRDSSTSALVLTDPLERNDKATVRIKYHGGDGVLRDEGVGVYAVGARSQWYPKFGDFSDPATYNLSFTTPKRSTVVAVGKEVESRETPDGQFTRWESTHPIRVAGFNYGRFTRYDEHEKNTGTDIEVWATAGTPDFIKELNMIMESSSGAVGYRREASFGVSPDSLARQALADGVNTVQLLTAYFGKLPFDRLALTQQVEWNFGQAWPTLVYLPYLAAMSSASGQAIGLEGYGGWADEVTYHEIAHQWWGHKIGWATYRDQWLSEGFAEFSTSLMVEAVEGAQAYDDFWEQRRLEIMRKDPSDDISNAESGPITLGYRNSSWRNQGGYRAIAYAKGGYVLHMLRMAMRDRSESNPDARFFSMMREFADSYAGQAPSTADFKRMVEKHIVPELDFDRNGKLDWFFDQWVHGTEIPDYDLDIEMKKSGSKWQVQGTVTQKGVGPDFVALVPVYLDLGKGQYMQLGRAPFKGEMTQNLNVTVEPPRKPKRALVNAQHEVLSQRKP